MTPILYDYAYSSDSDAVDDEMAVNILTTVTELRFLAYRKQLLFW